MKKAHEEVLSKKVEYIISHKSLLQLFKLMYRKRVNRNIPVGSVGYV